MFLMHCIEDNEVSEKYYREGVEHFLRKFGIEVTMFPACTPDTLSPELRFAEYKVATNKRKLKHPLTPTEKACFSTHFETWKRCIKLGKSVMCIEHDARLNPEITEKYDLKQKFDWFCRKGKDYTRDLGICFLGKPIATAYFMSPEYAKRLVNRVYGYQNRRSNITDPGSKGINMQTDTFLDSYHNQYVWENLNNETKNFFFVKKRYYKMRKVFFQSKDYGAVVDHGPLDK